jgi:hypothetical protein
MHTNGWTEAMIELKKCSTASMPKCPWMGHKSDNPCMDNWEYTAYSIQVILCDVMDKTPWF